MCNEPLKPDKYKTWCKSAVVLEDGTLVTTSELPDGTLVYNRTPMAPRFRREFLRNKERKYREDAGKDIFDD